MSIDEQVIKAGEGNMPNARFGDYSKIDVDPSNDSDFWFVTELIADGERKNFAGVFRLAPELANDVGIISIDSPVSSGTFTDSEEVTVTLFNYGIDPASNFDITLMLNGTVVSTGTFTSTLGSTLSASFTFDDPIDLSTPGEYTIVTTTNYDLDGNESNDSKELVINSLIASDVGVIQMTAPESGESLGNETITITIENFGGEAQSNFDVSYILDGGAEVVETFTETIAPGETAQYSFTQQGDFSNVGEHTVMASTLLDTDAIPVSYTHLTLPTTPYV